MAKWLIENGGRTVFAAGLSTQEPAGFPPLRVSPSPPCPQRVLGIHSSPIQRKPTIAPRVSADGTLVLSRVAQGEYRVRVTDLPPDYYIKDVRFNQTGR